MVVRSATKIAFLAAFSTAGWAAGLEVRVLDRDGAPVPGVVVVAEPRDGSPAAPPPEGVAMTQRNLSFQPEILVVQAGTSVSFPNEDAVKHHVYSFSPAKTFELPLYSGTEHPPEVFDTPGLVTLGCNIHDSMLGYVLVTASPHFGKTAPDGVLFLEGLDPGAYAVTIWHPRIRTKEPELVREAQVEAIGTTVVSFRLTRALKAHAAENPTSRWSDY